MVKSEDNRLERFIATAWPKEHLEENLKFIADSLGPNRDERPRDTIRRYLATGFYKHHLQMYKRRPIYWLFSSGKQRAFQCLVYLHRYNEGTLSRMRTEYVTKLQGKIDSRIGSLEEEIADPSSTARRKKLEKERGVLLKHRAELLAFDEKLRHYADQRISLDLDDGVKVNYGKFGDLLSRSEGGLWQERSGLIPEPRERHATSERRVRAYLCQPYFCPENRHGRNMRGRNIEFGSSHEESHETGERP